MIHRRLRPTELAERYLSAVLGYVTARVGVGADADDATAEVFAAAFAAWEHCPRPTNHPTDDPIRAWLFGIARRKVADVLRRRTRQPTAALDHSATVTDDTASALLATETAEQLARVLETLPTDQRQALELKYIERRSLREIGAVLQRSPAAVGTLLHRARAAARARGALYFLEEADDHP